ncbi:MAG: SUMF1/EgtB/PvdO family nonheme iron enzyme [Candidatus Latescibacterota bacterium]|nr:SUMF1/EgtB/PvdO family nonheme iron enzyme [Candidatus Latescibacterota bacterium]
MQLDGTFSVLNWRQSRKFGRWLTGAVSFCLLAFACSSPPAPNKPDEPPVADAGTDQSVAVSASVILDGSGSTDPELGPLSYQWSAAESNPSTVVLTTSPQVRIKLNDPGVYVFYLTVSAGSATSTPDSVRVTVTGGENSAPNAVAGPDYIASLGSSFFLDGSGSTDTEGDSLSYTWAVVAQGAEISIADSTAPQTEIDPLSTGAYTFRLTVSDGALTGTDEITITVTEATNLAPIADAGANQTVRVGTAVTLDGGASSDPEGASVSYRWLVGNNPGESVTLSDSTFATPSFIPNLLGSYVFGLKVSDGTNVSLQDTVVIRVVTQTYARRSGMIEIPEGSFTMGSASGQSDEAPLHTVRVAAFWVDSVEVTAAEYSLCVRDGDCATPGEQPDCNFGLDERADHPINCVDWAQAEAFCNWADKRLPTEAEWEKVARGPNDERRYPWGDEDPNLLLITFPTLQLLNYNALSRSTSKVGQHPDGISSYGVHNLGGNVMEWVEDWYGRDYYQTSPTRDPSGPATGEQRVARGGHYLAPREAVTVSIRVRNQPGTRDPTVGFRCARTEAPP